MAGNKSVLKLVDFNSSLFWTMAGVVSVASTITAINQRVRVQASRVDRGRAGGTRRGA
jgi:hypothetical protein